MGDRLGAFHGQQAITIQLSIKRVQTDFKVKDVCVCNIVIILI